MPPHAPDLCARWRRATSETACPGSPAPSVTTGSRRRPERSRPAMGPQARPPRVLPTCRSGRLTLPSVARPPAGTRSAPASGRQDRRVAGSCRCAARAGRRRYARPARVPGRGSRPPGWDHRTRPGRAGRRAVLDSSGREAASPHRRRATWVRPTSPPTTGRGWRMPGAATGGVSHLQYTLDAARLSRRHRPSRSSPPQRWRQAPGGAPGHSETPADGCRADRSLRPTAAVLPPKEAASSPTGSATSMWNPVLACTWA